MNNKKCKIDQLNYNNSSNVKSCTFETKTYLTTATTGDLTHRYFVRIIKLQKNFFFQASIQ